MMNEYEQGNEVRRKKDRKIQKHFSAVIDGEKSKVINYRFKNETHQNKKIQILEVISKFKIQFPKGKSTKIKVDMDKKMIEAEVRWHHGIHEPGNSVEAFQIIEIINEK